MRPFSEDTLQVVIDLALEKEGETGGCAHRPVEDGVDGEANEAVGVRVVCDVVPLRGFSQDLVEEFEHAAEVADLRVLERGVVAVRWRVGNLGEHPVAENLEDAVGLDSVLEGDQDGVQWLL